MPKPYVPNTWTDNVTPVDKAHMDNIENELIWLDARVGPGSLVSYGTTLPGSPADGQEAILVDSTTNPSYQWRFRYNAGSSSSYKWEFVGGTPLSKRTETVEPTSSGTPVDLTTVDNIIVPRAGDYACQWGAYGSSNGANDNVFDVLLFVQLAQAVTSEGWSNATGWGATVSAFYRANAVAASGDIRLRYASPTGRSENFRWRWLTVTPIRVS